MVKSYEITVKSPFFLAPPHHAVTCSAQVAAVLSGVCSSAPQNSEVEPAKILVIEGYSAQS